MSEESYRKSQGGGGGWCLERMEQVSILTYHKGETCVKEKGPCGTEHSEDDFQSKLVAEDTPGDERDLGVQETWGEIGSKTMYLCNVDSGAVKITDKEGDRSLAELCFGRRMCEGIGVTSRVQFANNLLSLSKRRYLREGSSKLHP